LFSSCTVVADKVNHKGWQLPPPVDVAAANPTTVAADIWRPLHNLCVICAGTHTSTNEVCHIVAEHVDLNITANNIQVVPITDHYTLSRGLPGPCVGVRTWTGGDVVANSRSASCTVANRDISHLDATVSQEEPGRTICVVTCELEALPEAASSYPKGVGDFDIPAAGGAVSQLRGVGRGLQEPVPGGSMDGGQADDEPSTHAS